MDGVYKQIEIAGRTCYQSEQNAILTTAKNFVDKLEKNGHLSMLEHGAVYLKIPRQALVNGEVTKDKWYVLMNNQYIKHKANMTDGVVYFSTNYRVIVENGLRDYLCYMTNPTEWHEKRVTVKFVCDIGVSREFNRHRANSMAEQSTRYCNFSKERFGSQLNVICPPEFKIDDMGKMLACWGMGHKTSKVFRGMCDAITQEKDHLFDCLDLWVFANLAAEWAYLKLIDLGWRPEQARRILPLDTKTELVHTAFVSDWKHFFDLRCASNAHPQAQQLAIPLYKEFQNKGWV